MLSKNLVEEPPIRSVGGDTGSFASRMLAIGVVSVQCPPGFSTVTPWCFSRGKPNPDEEEHRFKRVPT